MIEKIIIEYLNRYIRAYLEMPKNIPERFVLVEKTGGSRENCINRATVAVQSYAGSLTGAAELNEEIKEAMLKMTELETIGSCELNTDAYFPDTTTKKYRYQAVFDIAY